MNTYSIQYSKDGFLKYKDIKADNIEEAIAVFRGYINNKIISKIELVANKQPDYRYRISIRHHSMNHSDIIFDYPNQNMSRDQLHFILTTINLITMGGLDNWIDSINPNSYKEFNITPKLLCRVYNIGEK